MREAFTKLIGSELGMRLSCDPSVQGDDMRQGREE
jgi:hypothetical protein